MVKGYTKTCIIGSENGERIKCSAIVEEKKNVVLKKIFACDNFDFGLKWQLQKTNWENIYHEVTEIMNETTFMLFSKKCVIYFEKSFFGYLWLANKILW